MDIDIVEAAEDARVIVRNLVHFCIYDMAEHTGCPAPADGRYDGCDQLDSYWRDADRHPFLVRVDGELAGFSRVNRHQGVWHIGEFFIVRKFRRRGVGSAAARVMFDRFHGRWCVMSLPANRPAVAFWRRVIDACAAGRFTCDPHRRDPGRPAMVALDFHSPASP